MVTGYAAGTPFGACILFASIWLRSDYSTWQWLGQIIFAGLESRTGNITTQKMPDETSMWETVDQSARAGPLNEADNTTWRPIVQNRHPKTNYSIRSSGNTRRSQRRKANKTWCQPRGPVLAQNRTIATPTDTQPGLTERAARDGHTPIWQPSCGDRPTSPEPRADNTHSLRPTELDRQCVKASILHMESPSHWREDTKVWQVETRHQAQLNPQDRPPAGSTWMESSAAKECQWYAKCQGR